MSLYVPEELKKTEERYLPFRSEEIAETEVYFREVEEIPDVTGEKLVKGDLGFFSVYEKEGNYLRVFRYENEKYPYAVFQQTGRKTWECCYQKAYRHCFLTVGSCFRHIALERILLSSGAVVLHASLIRVRGEGIVFTGSSGVGKSTQAALWEKEEQAEILNGDRTVVQKLGKYWYGFGSPYAGSSQIYRNEGVRIRAVVALAHAETETCSRVSAGEAFRIWYAGVTWNMWNPEYREQVLSLIQTAAQEIPVFRLACRPDVRAVWALKEALTETKEKGGFTE